MAQYPVSCLDGTASKAFLAVLQFHRGGDHVLDLTYGEGHSWKDAGLFESQIELVKADLHPKADDVIKQDVHTAVEDREEEWCGVFDVVYYDPPYFIDVDASSDPRAVDYGGYAHDAAALARYMNVVPYLWRLVRPGGKIIVKCGDQYHVKSRRLLLHHIEWVRHVGLAFNVVDFFVYRYHRVSPTAYQVKDRPSAVVAHSYFIVGQLPADGMAVQIFGSVKE